MAATATSPPTHGIHHRNRPRSPSAHEALARPLEVPSVSSRRNRTAVTRLYISTTRPTQEPMPPDTYMRIAVPDILPSSAPTYSEPGQPSASGADPSVLRRPKLADLVSAGWAQVGSRRATRDSRGGAERRSRPATEVRDPAAGG